MSSGSKGRRSHMSEQDRRVARAFAITFAVLAYIFIPVILIAALGGCDAMSRSARASEP